MLILASLLALATGTVPASPHELTLGVVGWEYRGFLSGSEPLVGLELGYRHSVQSTPLSVGALVRAAAPNPGTVVPLEVGISLELRAPIGFWQPGAGVELGWSGLSQVDLSWRGGLPPGAHTQEEALLGPWYLGFGVSPLRFAFGRWTVSALELQLGATAFPLGAGARVQLGLLKAGVSL